MSASAAHSFLVASCSWWSRGEGANRGRSRRVLELASHVTFSRSEPRFVRSLSSLGHVPAIGISPLPMPPLRTPSPVITRGDVRPSTPPADRNDLCEEADHSRFRRGATARVGAIVSLSWLVIACASGPEPTFVGAPLDDQEASFAPYRGRAVQGQPLRDYLAERTPWLVAGIDFHAGQALGEAPAVFGAAVALTEDGYLLTATHNAARTPVYVLVPYTSTEGRPPPCVASGQALMFDIGGRLLIAHRARVVWDGGTSGGGTDVSLIAVGSSLDHHFDGWAEHGALILQDPVVSAGWPLPETGLERMSLDEFALGLAAGPLVQAGRASPSTAVITIYGFVHGSPLRIGYSGGPLTTLEGELIGVNVRVRETEDGLCGVGLAPHPHWLAEMIALDRRAQALEPAAANGAGRGARSRRGKVPEER